MPLYLGVHVGKSSQVLSDNKSYNIEDAIDRDLNTLGLNSAQIFTHGPRFLVTNKMDYDAVAFTCSDIDLTVHSAYPTVSALGATQANKTEGKYSRALKGVKSQMQACEKIGAWGLVIHVVKSIDTEIVAAAMKRYVQPIARKTGVKAILEMVASKAGEFTYETPEKLDNLTTLIGPNENWWGWCIDTAHLWGAGVDVRDYATVKAMLNRITHKRKILMFHLNGSFAACGSGKDKHAIPFSTEDKIWGNVPPIQSGARAIIEFAIDRGATIICEINRGSEAVVRSSMSSIKQLAKNYMNPAPTS